MTITAIETRYAGCHFRSRLEARWAVFFDAANPCAGPPIARDVGGTVVDVLGDARRTATQVIDLLLSGSRIVKHVRWYGSPWELALDAARSARFEHGESGGG